MPKVKFASAEVEDFVQSSTQESDENSTLDEFAWLMKKEAGNAVTSGDDQALITELAYRVTRLGQVLGFNVSLNVFRQSAYVDREAAKQIAAQVANVAKAIAQKSD